MEIIPSLNFREFLDFYRKGDNLEGSIAITLNPQDVDQFRDFFLDHHLPLSNSIISIENGPLESYSLEKMMQRKKQLEVLVSSGIRFIELKHPFDTSLLSKLPASITPILAFEDFEGIAKIDFNMILKLHRKYPKLIFKIIATPESIVDLNQLILWGKEMQTKGITHVIVCNGKFSSLTPFLHTKLANEFIIYRPKELTDIPISSFMRSRIISICGEILHEISSEVKIQKQSDCFFGKNQLETQIDRSSKKIAILGHELLGSIEEEFFIGFSNQTGTKLSSVIVPIYSQEETNIFIQGLGRELFDGFSFIGSDLPRIEGIDIFDISTAKTGITTFLLKNKNELISFDTYHILFEKILEPVLERDIVNIYIEGVNPVLFSLLPIFHSKADLIKIRNRSKEKLDIITQYFPKVEPVFPDENHSFDVVINFVPFGTRGLPHMLPFSKKVMADASLIIDFTTSENLTPLQQEAFSQGKTFYTGLDIIGRKSFIEQQLVFRNM